MKFVWANFNQWKSTGNQWLVTEIFSTISDYGGEGKIMEDGK